MGFTHYWSRGQAEIPLDLWQQALAKIRPIVAQNKALLSDIEVSDERIFFNGCYETFHVERVLSPEAFTFCKTAQKPYDPVVVACLVILATTLKGDDCGFAWSSDGRWPKEHATGLELSGIPLADAVGPSR